MSAHALANLENWLANLQDGDSFVYEKEDPTRPGQGIVTKTFFAVAQGKVFHGTGVYTNGLCVKSFSAPKDIQESLATCPLKAFDVIQSVRQQDFRKAANDFQKLPNRDPFQELQAAVANAKSAQVSTRGLGMFNKSSPDAPSAAPSLIKKS